MSATTVIDITARMIDQTSSGVNSVINSMNRITASMHSLQAQLSRCETQVEVRATLRDYASQGIRALTSTVSGMVGKAFSVTATLIDYATAPIKSIIDLVKSPITQVITLTGVTMGAQDVLTTYGDYEQGIANTWARLAGSSTDHAGDREKIENEAKRLGATTQFTAGEAAKSFEILSGSGWNAQQIEDGAQHVLDLASAGGIEMESSANVMTNTMAYYGYTQEEGKIIADILAKTEASSKANIEGLSGSLAYFGGTAGKTFDYSLEDSAVLLAILAESGISGSRAGTSLSTLFNNMNAPTDTQKVLLDNMGLTMFENGEYKDAISMIYDMREAFNSLELEERGAYINKIAGSEADDGLVAILGMDDAVLENLIETIYDYNDAASEMAAIKLDTTYGSLEILKSAVADVKIAIGERLSPAFRDFTKLVADSMPGITELVHEAFDWWDETYPEIQQTITRKVETVTDSEEYQDGTIFQKVHLLFDELVADPIGDWWDNYGRNSVSNISSFVGETLGGILSGGILTLFGAETGTVISEGTSIGVAFMEGFLSAIDFTAIQDAISAAIKFGLTDAQTIFSGGDSVTSWISAGIATYAGTKTLQGARSLYDLGSSTIGAGQALSTAITDAGGLSAYATTTATAAATTAVPIVTIAGNAFNGLVGSSKAEEWTGSDSLWNKFASGTGAILGGTFDGIGNSVVQTGIGAATGAAIGGIPGAIAGGVVGLAGSLIGGDTIAQTLTGTLGYEHEDTSPMVEEASQKINSATDSASESVAEPVQTFMEETVPETISNMVDSSKERLSSYGEEGSESLVEPVNTLFEETLPESVSQVVEGASELLDSVSESAIENMAEPIQGFMEGTLPETLSGVVDGTGELIKSYGDEAMGSLAEPFAEFFEATLPDSVATVLEESGALISEHSGSAMETLAESTSLLFEERIPLTFQELWFATEDQLVISSAIAESTIAQGVSAFYEVYIPSSLQYIWDSAMSHINSCSSTASSTVNVGIASFFTSASSSVSGFFSSAQSQMNSAMATASAAISSLSLAVSSATNSTANGNSNSVPAYANGGILSTPHLGLVAEAGPEAIIPLSNSRRSRGIELWEQAGEMLGVTPYANGGIVGLKSFGGSDSFEKSSDGVLVSPFQGKSSEKVQMSGGTGGNISISLGGVTLNVNAKGGSEMDILAVIREHLGELTDEIASELANSLKTVFGNMPCAVEY